MYMFRVVAVFFIFLLLTLTPTALRAELSDVVQWHTTNIQYLRGWGYELGQQDRTIITVEHAHGWTYGDFYMFVDTTRFDGGGSNFYAEYSPRLSLGKITNQDFSYGVIKDVLLSSNIEDGEKSARAYLYGAAIDFNLPGFKFFKVNLYQRDNPDKKGETYQLTLAWNRPFEVNGTKFLIEGFADFAGNEGPTYKANQLIVPRFLVDIGDLMGNTSGKLWAGVEYSHWHNKLGNEGVTESHPQLQVKWVF